MGSFMGLIIVICGRKGRGIGGWYCISGTVVAI